jgi:colanic acid/amylovoran biosynthesis glycosyltransferase
MSRIIYLTVRAPLGSGEEFIIPEMMELLHQKHALLIVPRSPSGSQITQPEAAVLKSYCLYQPLLSWIILHACIKELVHTPLKCLRLFLRILSHSGKISNICKNLAVFPKSLWLAHLSRMWKAEHLHAHWASSTATMASVASEITGIPWSFTAHRWDIVDNNMFEAKVRSAAFVRFISNNGLQLAKSVLKGNIPAKCHIIHMGVDLPIEPSSSNRDDKQGFTIMCPANLLPVKGHTYLLQALKVLQNQGISYQLLLAGQGPLLNSLKQQVEEFGIQDRVTFLGQVPHSALLEYYGKNVVDLVVLPSIDLGNGLHEGIPVSLMEAMAFNIPVIATATGGIPELIGEGAGILVPEKDSDALADAIESLIKDAHLRNSLAFSGYQQIKEAFNVTNTVNNLYLLITDYDIR